MARMGALAHPRAPFPAQRHAKVKDPWEARTRFTPLETVWSPLNLTAVKEARHRAWELLPLAFVLKSLDHQPASLGQLRTTGGVPWCVRLHWVNQVPWMAAPVSLVALPD